MRDSTGNRGWRQIYAGLKRQLTQLAEQFKRLVPEQKYGGGALASSPGRLMGISLVPRLPENLWKGGGRGR
jgi:hypothetical protein